MSKRNNTLTQERLKELLHYDPNTGVFTRRVNTSRGKAGTVAGSRNVCKETGKVRMRVSISRVVYWQHVLAWLYMTGNWPDNEIDHKDGDSANNRFDNLRDVTRVINCQNRVRPQTDNKCGFLGVFWEKRFHVWIAKVTVGKKSIHVGSFKTPEEAHAAYVQAKRRLHPGCTI